MNMRKTKIICTLGPAVDHAETIERLIRTGMNAARFNFSHGSHAEQLARLNMFKKVRDTLGAPWPHSGHQGPRNPYKDLCRRPRDSGAGPGIYPDHR